MEIDRYHEHGQEDDAPAFDPYDGYSSGYDTDWSYPVWETQGNPVTIQDQHQPLSWTVSAVPANCRLLFLQYPNPEKQGDKLL